VIGWVAGGLALATWLYLAIGHGRFWSTSIRLPRSAAPSAWPGVVAVVPARDEATLLPTTLPALLGQDYPGAFTVIVVDDDSSDDTADVARRAGATVVSGNGPPPGWTGKVAALARGVACAGQPDFFLFTDADIAYPADALTKLVGAAVTDDRVMVSQMVRLRTQTGWERLLVPAFVYFFAQLYPFGWVNGRGRTAAAAGGCVLVRRVALERAGGLEAIRSAVIDDVALGRLVKRQGRIWLGLSDTIRSVRPYPQLRDLWQMVARSAYTQLRYSPLWLVGTVIGLLVVYGLPPALVIGGVIFGSAPAAALGGAAWLIMTLTYLPIQRFYQLAAGRALLLPVVAGLYLAMTLDSARRHRTGRGAEWKGRIGAGHDDHRQSSGRRLAP
jgi:hopene-associated glycosyltransferase HpnB